MERTITHEGARWRVAVHPSRAHAGSESDLDDSTLREALSAALASERRGDR